VADLALLAQLGERAELVGGRHRGVDPGQLVQVDALQPQPP
jgi:hypothetical protein